MIKRHEGKVTVVGFGDKNAKIDLLQSKEMKRVGLGLYEEGKADKETVVLYFKTLESLEVVEDRLRVIKNKYKELNNIKTNTHYEIEQLRQSNKVMHERLSTLLYVIENNVSYHQKNDAIKRGKEAIELYK